MRTCVRTRSRRTGAAQAFLTGEIPPLKRLKYIIDCFRKNLHALSKIAPTMRRLHTQSEGRQIMLKVAIKNRGFFATAVGCFLLFIAMAAQALGVDAVWDMNKGFGEWNMGNNWASEISSSQCWRQGHIQYLHYDFAVSYGRRHHRFHDVQPGRKRIPDRHVRKFFFFCRCRHRK